MLTIHVIKNACFSTAHYTPGISVPRVGNLPDRWNRRIYMLLQLFNPNLGFLCKVA